MIVLVRLSLSMMTCRILYLVRVKKIIIMTDKQRVLIFSAFSKTFPRQYKNAAKHRNHSKRAISIKTPTTET